ncbi:MAG TPA: DNA-3-methyladenine glycosylase [Ohtaekwangia sp.]|nr:DNA-3-methyladenine glycosylase [Ohtaekwangia sp.]
MKLSKSFYERANVVKIASDLIGKALFTRIGNCITGGIIVETEAYSWKERGCHAFQKRKTERNAIMFGEGGYSYVYLCYGMHHLFNVVTNKNDIPEAVLIRAIEPRVGIEEMKLRRGVKVNGFQLTSGPGKLTRALGIDRKLNAKNLLDDEVWIEDIGERVPASRILASPRIGIDYAGEDAALPWRFTLKENLWVSR